MADPRGVIVSCSRAMRCRVQVSWQFAAGAAEGMDGAMVADVELLALNVELRLGAVARVRERRGSSKRVASIGGMKGTAALLS